MQPYQGFSWFHVLRAGPEPAADALPASLEVSGCPRGAEVFLFPAADIAADPAWRSKPAADGPHHLGGADHHHVVVFSATPQA